MKTGKMIGGVVLILVALYLLFAIDNGLLRWGGGIIVGALGIWMTMKAMKEGGGADKPAAPTPPTQSQQDGVDRIEGILLKYCI